MKDQVRIRLDFGVVVLDAYAAVREDSLAVQRTYRPIGP
jgi:hypothetical protein